MALRRSRRPHHRVDARTGLVATALALPALATFAKEALRPTGGEAWTAPLGFIYVIVLVQASWRRPRTGGLLLTALGGALVVTTWSLPATATARATTLSFVFAPLIISGLIFLTSAPPGERRIYVRLRQRRQRMPRIPRRHRHAAAHIPDLLDQGAALGLTRRDVFAILDDAYRARRRGVPIGIPEEAFVAASRAAREAAARLPYGDDIVIQGSRVRGYSLELDDDTGKLRPLLRRLPPVDDTTDLDVAVRLSPEAFERALRDSFGKPNPRSAKERSMIASVTNERIFNRYARPNVRYIRRALAATLDIPEDQIQVTLVRAGGRFDSAPSIPIR